jgi:putative MATE family efflux protein
MTRGPEWKAILLFTLPIMAGNFLQQLYNTVDSVVVGQSVGQNALSAVGTCTPLVMLFLALAIGLGIGVSVVVSQFFGAGRTADMAQAITTASWLMTGIGLALTAVAEAATPFLLSTALGVQNPETLVMAVRYFRVYAGGLVFQFIYNCAASVLRAVGDSKATLYFLAVSSALNIGLDLLFVVVFHWGVAGAGAATVLAQIVCAGVSVVYLRRTLAAARERAPFQGALCKLILKMGIPASVQMGIVSMGNLAMQRLVNGFGDAAMAAYTAGIRIDNFVTIPALGFHTGMANFTGQNIGAGKWDRVRRGLGQTVVMSFGLCALMGVAAFVLARPLVAMFGVEGEALEMGVEMIRFLALIFWLFAVYQTCSGVLEGAGDVVVASGATLTALLVRVCTGYLAVYLGLLRYNAGWATMPVGWSVALLIVLARYFSGRWKTKAVVKNARPEEET